MTVVVINVADRYELGEVLGNLVKRGYEIAVREGVAVTFVKLKVNGDREVIRARVGG